MANNFSSWNGWDVVKVLGKGSYGSVYQIERQLHGTAAKEHAALKVLSIPQDAGEIDELSSQGYDMATITSFYSQQRDEILREYNIMLDLKGETNIVSCDDVQWVPDENGVGWTIYIRMELLRPLREAFGNEYDEAAVIRLGRDLCHALIRCKQENIIHRDIKPQNILLSQSGDFKLGDFGVAKVSEKTMSGTITGTYEYMAPEVFRAQKYNTSVDIYSLGLVMYAMMNNRRTPFMPQPPQIPSSSQTENARSRRFSGEAIPEPVHGSDDLKRIVLKACAFDPNDRFHSPQEMLDALESLESGMPVYLKSTPAPAPEDVEEDGTVCAGGEGETVVELSSRKSVTAPTPARPANPKPVHKRTQKKRSRLPLILGTTAAVVAVAIAALSLGKPKEEPQTAETTLPVVTQAPETMPIPTETTVIVTEPTETVPVVTEAPVTEPTVPDTRWVENVLRKDTMGSASTPAYNSRVKKSQIYTVTFLDSLQTAPMTSMDVSKSYNNSVKVWFIGSGDIYDMYIAAEGGINGSVACENLFAHYTNLRKVRFNGNFHTEQVTVMTNMFLNCKALEEVDIQVLDTSAVTAMNCMFSGCESIRQLDLANFNTDSVTNMAAMFENCRSLESLDLTTFQTAGVTAMHYMFAGCETLDELDLSMFDTAKVRKMSQMFKGCANLKVLNISSFDTSKVELFQEMFLGCSSLGTPDIRHFSTASATDYYSFMDPGREVDGKPWEELFE